MKTNLLPPITLFFMSNFICGAKESIKSETGGITLLTVFMGNINVDEGVDRFVRRAVFNGYEQGRTLRIVEPSPSTKSLNASFEQTKLETIKSAIRKLSSEANPEDVILYLDYNVSMVLSGPDEILKIFQSSNVKALLSSDSTQCFTSSNNGAINYPNFAGFIGFTNSLQEIFNGDGTFSASSISEVLSMAYATSSKEVKLDTSNSLFHTIPENSANVNLNLKLTKDTTYLFPTVTTKSKPQKTVHIVQTNLCKSGNSYSYFNALGSYLTPTLPEDKIILPENDEDLPTVALTIFIERPTPFMEEFFTTIEELDYPKEKIDLFIHNHYRYNAKDVHDFLQKNAHFYRSLKYLRSQDRVKEWAARTMAVDWVLLKKSAYWFNVDSTARIDDESTVRRLIEANKCIVGPMLCTPSDFLPNICNWWGAVSLDGFYSKSSDYDEIAENRHKGIWNVPLLSHAYLIKASVLANNTTRPNFIRGMVDADLAFAANNRERGIFMHVLNEFHAGHLVISDNIDTGHLHDDLYQIFDNRFDWENRYIHPNHSLSLKDDYEALEPCRDVFWFPIVTPRFAEAMIEEMEHYGKWADGSIEARGDLYPTVDIQMHEIGFDKHIHEFLRLYISPLQEKVFGDYEVYPPRTNQAFVVRYTAEDQRELKPHFDESTYTLNIALNTPHKDFEGGGCRFTRFNCSVVDTRLGWGFLHPGQFTHKHEGLKVTNGTRYILVSFIDPTEFDDD